LELNRKMVSIILVVLIVLVPVSVAIWTFYGPTRIDKFSLDAVAPDLDNGDGVYVIGTATGSGQDFEQKADLLVYHESEQVYTGKVQFREGLLNEKLAYEDFCRGNGEYEFRLIYEDRSDRYTVELNQIVEELGVVSTATYQLEGSGAQPWQVLYSYNVVFKTGWHFFTLQIDKDLFRSYDLGTQFKDTSAPLKVETGPEAGVKVEVWFTNPGGVQSRIRTFDVSAGDSLDTTIEFDKNGSYLYKYVNEKTTDIEIRAWMNLPIDKLPDNGEVIVTQRLGTDSKEDTQLISEVDRLSSYVRPQYGPGNYTMTIDYPNPQVMSSSPLSTVSFTEVIELNDKPRAIGKVNPTQISTLQRTVTFDATDSFDDGPKEDLWVIWSFGANDEGEIGSVEGPWDTYKTYTYTYLIGENPDVTDGKPYLVLKDKYGAESSIAYINLAVG